MNRDLKNLWNLKDLKDLISEDDIKQYNRFQRILRTTKDRRIYNILYRKLILVEKGRTNKNILKSGKKQRSWKKYRPNQCKDVKFRRVNYGYKAITKKRVESI